MAKHPVVRVGCRRCGWRGRRVYDLENWCECDYACSHSIYGYCPHAGCGGTVVPMWELSEHSRRLAQAKMA